MDYNDFYTKSLEAGAQPDQNGGIHHTPASIATMQMNRENERFANESMYRHSRAEPDFGHSAPLPRSYGFWGWFFNGK